MEVRKKKSCDGEEAEKFPFFFIFRALRCELLNRRSAMSPVWACSSLECVKQTQQEAECVKTYKRP